MFESIKNKVKAKSEDHKLDPAVKIAGIYFVISYMSLIVYVIIMQFQTFDRYFFLNTTIYIWSFYVIISAVLFYFLIHRDMALVVESQNKRRESEQRFHVIFNDSSAFKILLDANNLHIVDANRAFCSFLQKDIACLKTMTLSDLFSDKAEYDVVKNYIIASSDGAPLVFKYSAANSEIVYFELFADFIESGGNAIIYLTTYNVTEKVNLEKQNEEYKINLEKLVSERTTELENSNILLERENKRIKIIEEQIKNQLIFFRTVIETIPNPLFIKGLDGKYLECNKAFTDYFDVKRETVIGKTAHDIIPVNLAEKSVSYDQEIIEKRKFSKAEISFTDAKDALRFAQYLKTPLINAEDKIEGLVGMINDITDYKNMQIEIENALEKEQEINKLKSRFISMVSHEFRTPLTTILASADLLEMFGREWIEAKYNEHTAKIRRTVKYMVELLDDVLTISRADAGKLVFNPVNFNIFNFCCEIVENLKNSDAGKHEIVFEYLKDRKIVSADSKLLNQIFSNLLSNAIKYSPEGTEIKFSIDFSEKDMNVFIGDNGIGISEEDQKLLFEPFQRGENIGAIPGTGLGLSIVKRSVDMHKGSITYKSELGKGTSFNICIPVGMED
jgi:PAS domain S-box-containing protein